jgi:hypothetical protein
MLRNIDGWLCCSSQAFVFTKRYYQFSLYLKDAVFRVD